MRRLFLCYIEVCKKGRRKNTKDAAMRECQDVVARIPLPLPLLCHCSPQRCRRRCCGDASTGAPRRSGERREAIPTGITFEPSPPYTQHKNGVSERMIQTHNAKARAMLLDCSLPPSMWVEAISTANYLQSRSPNSSNNGVTPYEKHFGRKPEVRHLRRFGYKAFKNTPSHPP